MRFAGIILGKPMSSLSSPTMSSRFPNTWMSIYHDGRKRERRKKSERKRKKNGI